jgi:hypothetical protein
MTLWKRFKLFVKELWRFRLKAKSKRRHLLYLSRWVEGGREHTLPTRIHDWNASYPQADRREGYHYFEITEGGMTPSGQVTHNQGRMWKTLKDMKAELGSNFVLLKRHRRNGSFVRVGDSLYDFED